MKKYNIFTHVVGNVIIVAILVGLYFACVPTSAVAQTSAPIYKNSSAENKVALMFNVYQGTEYVEQILKVLEKYDVTSTFFFRRVLGGKKSGYRPTDSGTERIGQSRLSPSRSREDKRKSKQRRNSPVLSSYRKNNRQSSQAFRAAVGKYRQRYAESV